MELGNKQEQKLKISSSQNSGGGISREKSELSYKLQGFCNMEVEYLCSFNAYLGLQCAKGEKLDKNQSKKNTRGKRNRDVMGTRMVKKKGTKERKQEKESSLRHGLMG